MSARERDDARALLSLAVHELRSPLTVATGSVQRLLASDTIDDETRALLERALRACRQVETIVGQMRDWTRLHDTPAAEPRPAPLAPALTEAAALVGAARPGLTVAIDAAPAVHVAALPGRLVPALAAVFSAVARPLPNGATLPIRTAVLGDRVAVQAGLTGRVQPAGHEVAEVGGLGFTLPLARAVLEAGGGRLSLARDGDERIAGAVVELRAVAEPSGTDGI
ncbi:MAG TPA: histidine kinase dimerization/phospho-acceptor domain-containing protein [Vicinamibacterales bacterium]